MADLSIKGARIDESRWRKMTPQEIIKEKSKGEEIPPAILAWAQQMSAFAKIPDDVTYERVDGDVGIDALNKLGIEDEPISPEKDNAQAPTETEEPDAVKDADKTEESEEEQDEFSLPASETADETEEKDEVEQEFSLADQALTADNDEIRKRKERKGIL